MSLPQVVLKPREEKRLQQGHLWVFSNEVGKVSASVEPGGLVDICTADGKFFARGFYHPRSLIAARILTRRAETIDAVWMEKTLRQAQALREKLYPGSRSYRLAFGESDFLPGLVVDRFEDIFVLQSYCTGADLLLPWATEALVEIFSPRAVVVKNDSPLRALENLPERKEVLYGQADFPTTITQSGLGGQELKFWVDPLSGQKSGFFFDQRENRARLARWASGKSVLDLFCYSGGFGLSAAQAHAKSVTCVDSSQPALDLAKRNFELNQLAAEFVCEDVEIFLAKARAQKMKFDIIVCDPPALAKSRKNLFGALRKYRDLNAAALALLNDGGILVSASCSHHVSREDFLAMLQEAASRAQKWPRLLELTGAAFDHPVALAMPETQYLKCAFLQVENV